MKVKKEAWELGTVVIWSFLQEIGFPLIYIPELNTLYSRGIRSLDFAINYLSMYEIYVIF